MAATARGGSLIQRLQMKDRVLAALVSADSWRGRTPGMLATATGVNPVTVRSALHKLGRLGAVEQEQPVLEGRKKFVPYRVSDIGRQLLDIEIEMQRLLDQKRDLLEKLNA